jgi:membrane protein implicated in regulation of membrane protease activity
MVWIWLSLAIALVVVEMSTTQLVSIWLALAAGITAIITALVASFGGNLPLAWQIVIYVASSAILLASTRKFVKKFLKKSKNQETNLELNLDKIAVVTEKIDNVAGEGAIKINGLIWTARSIDDSIIEVGELVIFKEIKGNKAFVVKK